MNIHQASLEKWLDKENDIRHHFRLFSLKFGCNFQVQKSFSMKKDMSSRLMHVLERRCLINPILSIVSKTRILQISRKHNLVLTYATLTLAKTHSISKAHKYVATMRYQMALSDGLIYIYIYKKTLLKPQKTRPYN